MPIPYSTIVFGGLTNPVTEDLDLSNNDILNVGTLNYTSLNPAIIGGSGTSSGVLIKFKWQMVLVDFQTTLETQHQVQYTQ
jgi:hypothetical protein